MPSFRVSVIQPRLVMRWESVSLGVLAGTPTGENTGVALAGINVEYYTPADAIKQKDQPHA